MKFDGTLLVVAPHQDDEVLGCGWLMRRVAAAGGKVVVAWLTDGGGSHGDLAPAARAALVARRRDEARAGLAALGVMPVAMHFLGFRDGSLADHVAAAHAALAAICREHCVDTVAVTGAGDNHPDHQASFRSAVDLPGVDVYTYAVSGRYDGEADSDRPGAVHVAEPDSAAKCVALACHVSQTVLRGARYPLSIAAMARFCAAPETFVPVPR